MGGAEQTADRHCGVMNGTPLPLSLGEVFERSEDGEGRRGCNTLSGESQGAALVRIQMREIVFLRDHHLKKAILHAQFPEA